MPLLRRHIRVENILWHAFRLMKIGTLCSLSFFLLLMLSEISPWHTHGARSTPFWVIIPALGIYAVLGGKLLCLTAPAGRRYAAAMWACFALCVPAVVLQSTCINVSLYLLATACFGLYLAELFQHYDWPLCQRRLRATARLYGATTVLGAVATARNSFVGGGDDLASNCLATIAFGFGLVAVGSAVRLFSSVQTSLRSRREGVDWKSFLRELKQGLRTWWVVSTEPV